MTKLRMFMVPVAISFMSVCDRAPTPTSNLAWHTDLDQAKAEALRTHRPILSLRMLGRLTDELSCANSRFFRTVLYADPQISALMAKDFVLHWSSEREVPVMTIDFGDGRTIRRTVIGNSAHYVLDAQGNVLDVIPGLYAPRDFAERLEWAKSLQSGDLAAQHRARRAELAANWSSTQSGLVGRGRLRVPATEAVLVAPAKAFVESRAIRASTPFAEPPPSDDQIEAALAKAQGPAELSAHTRMLMRSENPQLDDATFEAMVATFAKSVRKDTVHNEQVLHARIHERLGSDAPRESFEELNRWVYAELFGTPASDPWLGLHDDTTYTGLERAGISVR